MVHRRALTPGLIAIALAAKGVETHQGDLSDPASYKPALEGAYAAFVNTDCKSLTLVPALPDSLVYLLVQRVQWERRWSQED